MIDAKSCYFPNVSHRFPGVELYIMLVSNKFPGAMFLLPLG